MAEVVILNGKSFSSLIQENLRIERHRKNGKYLDINNNLTSVLSRSNHVIFGRRGTGKSALIAEAMKSEGGEAAFVWIDCEQLKDHSFPNVTVEILKEAMVAMVAQTSWWRCLLHPFLMVRVFRMLSSLRNMTKRPDESQSLVREESTRTVGTVHSGIQAKISESKHSEGTQSFKKLESVRLMVPNIKDLLDRVREINSKSKVLLFFDDFYHLPIVHQADIADIIHRLCKGNDLYFKIATIPHRSELYREESQKPVGIQSGHDYSEINIDFSLEKFKDTSDSLRSILGGLAHQVGIDDQALDTFFQGKGFDRLVLAAGGVPRDFLSLFVSFLNTETTSPLRPLGKDAVRDLAGKYHEKKKEDLKRDSDKGEVEEITRLFDGIATFCFDEKGKNCFQISRKRAANEPRTHKLIQRLADFRLIHRASSGISNPGLPGESFDVYMIDLGAYSYMRKLSGKLEEIDLSDLSKAGKDALRLAPVF